MLSGCHISLRVVPAVRGTLTGRGWRRWTDCRGRSSLQTVRFTWRCCLSSNRSSHVRNWHRLLSSGAEGRVPLTSPPLHQSLHQRRLDPPQSLEDVQQVLQRHHTPPGGQQKKGVRAAVSVPVHVLRPVPAEPLPVTRAEPVPEGGPRQPRGPGSAERLCQLRVRPLPPLHLDGPAASAEDRQPAGLPWRSPSGPVGAHVRQ